MRYKLTNFYENKKLKFYLFSVLSILFYSSILIGQVSYKMSIEDIKIEGIDKVSAEVYIENVGESFELTSYQCALSINQELELSSLKLSYVEGSSELLNTPDLYVGIENIDGTAELTFVSFIGNDVISKKTLVGRFVLEGKIDISKVSLLGIKWDFEGTVSTIITGKNFENITNPESHTSVQFESTETKEEKLTIIGVEASSTTDTNTTPIGVIDGKGKNDGEGNGRWATQTIPSTLILDLGEEKKIKRTRFSFFYYDKGRTYTYNVKVSKDKKNWEEIVSSKESDSTEWSETIIGEEVLGRYVELEIIGTKNNPGQWSNVWEAEIYGANSSSAVDEGEEEVIPAEYGISQNYPNPFNPSTKVQVKMKETGVVKLDVYNILGEKVLAVLDEELSGGIHEIDIDGSRLASGTYIYQLNIDGKFSQVKKMNLIK